jgi:hypothetical protein
LNQEDYGVGMLLHLRMMVPKELSRYTIKSDGSDGCHVFLFHVNTQPGRMDAGWMDVPYASLMCLHAMMLTARCVIFIATIVVMGMHKLSTIKIAQY